MPIIAPQTLTRFVTEVLQCLGAADAEATEVAEHLVRANLVGHDSHGVGTLPGYVRRCASGAVVPNQTLETVLDAGALLIVDAHRGFGQRMAAEATRRAVARARDLGACVLGLRNSAHIGRIGTYGELAAQAGCAFIGFVNVADDPPMQAPFGARAPRLGTNPVCIAVPGADGPALLLDMATTTIAYGKARVAHNKGEAVPAGALIDADGHPTTDPRGLIAGGRGALLSFGGHKGSGLAVMCEVLAAAMIGGMRADDPSRRGVVNNMLTIVIDLARLGDPEAIRRDIAAVVDHIRGSPAAPGTAEVLVPGDPERRAAAARAHGISIDPVTWSELRAAAQQAGLSEAEIDAALG